MTKAQRAGGGRRWAGWVLGVAVLGATAGCNDVVVLSNSATDERGVLVDGRVAGVDVSDRTFRVNSDLVGVGELTAAAGNNEVIAFTNRRPVAVRTAVPWTAGDDRIDMPFADEIVIPVKVWIVKGPFADQRRRAIDACITTSAIWNSERMGVRFGPFEIVDATGDPDASTFFDFTCTQRAALEAAIGKTAGRVNVYYVDRVDGGRDRGQACQIGSDFVAMASRSGDELLSHELGHDFGLTHIDDLTAIFDRTNVMHAASSRRQFLTEAQVFRSHLDPGSALNFLYAARPGQPTRACARDASSPTCPRIDKRIWADGAYAAN